MVCGLHSTSELGNFAGQKGRIVGRPPYLTLTAALLKERPGKAPKV